MASEEKFREYIRTKRDEWQDAETRRLPNSPLPVAGYVLEVLGQEGVLDDFRRDGRLAENGICEFVRTSAPQTIGAIITPDLRDAATPEGDVALAVSIVIWGLKDACAARGASA